MNSQLYFLAENGNSGDPRHSVADSLIDTTTVGCMTFVLLCHIKFQCSAMRLATVARNDREIFHVCKYFCKALCKDDKLL